MLTPALLALVALFALAYVGRVGAARRAVLMARWPVILFAGAAILALSRGLAGPGLLMAGLAVAAWFLWPRLSAARKAGAPTESAADREARAVLGVPAGASEAEIRRAYRDKMARAHPDRGGGHAQAARLTAARDRLLKRR